MTRHIVNLTFPTATDAVVTFDDGSSGHVSGVRAVQLRNVVTAFVDFIREQPDALLGVNDDLLPRIDRALKGEL